MSDTQHPTPDTDTPGPTVEPPTETGDTAEITISQLVADDDAPVVTPPTAWTETGRFGALSEYRATKKRREKRKKLARAGYVEWHLVDGAMSGPKFVRPTADGGGIPDLEYDGGRYIFPEEAAVPSTRSGMRVYVHKAGQFDPINLRDPDDHAVAPDQVQEYLETAIQTESPGGLLSDYSPGELLFYGLMGVVVLSVAYAAMTGGVV